MSKGTRVEQPGIQYQVSVGKGYIDSMSSEVDAMDFSLQIMKDLQVGTISWDDPSLNLNDPLVLAN
jgi:hypothetical protein